LQARATDWLTCAGVALREAGCRVWKRTQALLAHIEWKLDALVLNRRFGFPREAAKIVWLDDLGLASPGRNSYSPSSWGALKCILPASEVRPEDVFIDVGCGMGRVVFEAAGYPFRRVIGVDIAPSLVEAARTVIEKNRHRLRCADVELAVADAATYRIPDDVTIAYVANPVEGELFEALLTRLIESVDRNPRRLRVIYVDPREAARLEANRRIAPVRNWRRGLRRWEPADYMRMYEILPA
jgi:SAM-dependent methyltransferase